MTIRMFVLAGPTRRADDVPGPFPPETTTMTSAHALEPRIVHIYIFA